MQETLLDDSTQGVNGYTLKVQLHVNDTVAHMSDTVGLTLAHE